MQPLIRIAIEVIKIQLGSISEEVVDFIHFSQLSRKNGM